MTRILQREPVGHHEEARRGPEIELGHADESHALVHRARDLHQVGGVQAQRFAARLARAPNAFFGERASDAAAARGGIDGEKAERGP